MSTTTDLTLSEQDIVPTESTEIGTSRQQASAMTQVQAQTLMALRNPRNEDRAYQRIMKAAGRYSFAERATYAYRRSGRMISGGSTHLAAEMARCWGNVTFGTNLDYVDDDKVAGTSYAWDIEQNVLKTRQWFIPKLQQRKNEHGETQWVVPDARDLRELFFNIAARNERECIFKVIPPDFLVDALGECGKTIAAKVHEDPEAAKKQIVKAFGTLSVTVEMLEAYLEVPIGQAQPKQIAELRKMYKTIDAGEATWRDYVNGNGDDKPQKTEGSIKPKDIRPSEDANRGHDEAAPERKLRTVRQLSTEEELRVSIYLVAKGINGKDRQDEFFSTFPGSAEDLMALVSAWGQQGKRTQDGPQPAAELAEQMDLGE